MPLFYGAIYITVYWALTAGDYASEVCVPLALRYTMERMRISGYVHAKKLIFPEFPISKRKTQLTHFPKASSSQK